ncbi:MAG: tyrosine-type recombinase/integrase [Firmicutes bacterium]|nr:tyrosine-type recombinase/integrase [Bacillota bacterium]
MNYFKERENRTLVLLEIQKQELPPFSHRFFTGIAQRTSSLTRLNYSYDLGIFFNYLVTQTEEFGEKIENLTEHDLERIEVWHVEMYMEWLGSNNGDKAKMRKLATLRSFFAYCFKVGLISKNILPNIDMPKLQEKPIARLERDEIREMFNRIENMRDRTILLMFLMTGIRVSELVGLDVCDIDLKNTSFRVTRKGGKQEILYMPRELVNQIEAYLDAYNLDETSPLFPSNRSRRICVRSVQNLVKKYTSLVTPLKNISPHKLRSTFGTNLYRETGDIYVVASVLGHKDVNTTKKHYASMSEDIKRAAADKVKLF